MKHINIDDRFVAMLEGQGVKVSNPLPIEEAKKVLGNLGLDFSVGASYNNDGLVVGHYATIPFLHLRLTYPIEVPYKTIIKDTCERIIECISEYEKDKRNPNETSL